MHHIVNTCPCLLLFCAGDQRKTTATNLGPPPSLLPPTSIIFRDWGVRVQAATHPSRSWQLLSSFPGLLHLVRNIVVSILAMKINTWRSELLSRICPDLWACFKGLLVEAQVPVSSIDAALGSPLVRANSEDLAKDCCGDGRASLDGNWRLVGDEPSWFMPCLLSNRLAPEVFWTRREPANSLLGLNFLLAFTCDKAHCSPNPWTDMHLGLRCLPPPSASLPTLPPPAPRMSMIFSNPLFGQESRMYEQAFSKELILYSCLWQVAAAGRILLPPLLQFLLSPLFFSIPVRKERREWKAMLIKNEPRGGKQLR